MRSTLLLLALAGCSNDTTGAHDLAVPNGYRESSCGMCVGAECASQISTCSADPGCAAYLSCLYACPLSASGDADQACERACPQSTSTTTMQALQALSSCRTTASCASCGRSLPDGGMVPAILSQSCPAPQMDAGACIECWDEHCCDTFAACKNDSGCQALKACIRACPSDSTETRCFYDCYRNHKSAMPLYLADAACVSYSCEGSCVAERGACSRCAVTQCLSQWAACETDPGCSLIFFCDRACACNQTCDTRECTAACAGIHPDGADLLDDLTLCLGQRCSAVCT